MARGSCASWHRRKTVAALLSDRVMASMSARAWRASTLRRRFPQGVQGFAKKIEVHLLAADDAFKLGNTGKGLRQFAGALGGTRNIRWLCPSRTQLRSRFAVQSGNAVGFVGLPAAAKGDVVPQGVLIPLGERTLTRPMATNPRPGFCSFPLGAGVAPPVIISNGRRCFGNVPIPASAENKKGPLLSDPCRLK